MENPSDQKQLLKQKRYESALIIQSSWLAYQYIVQMCNIPASALEMERMNTKWNDASISRDIGILEESVTSQFFLWKTFRTLWQVTEGPKALRIRDEEGRL